VNVQGVNLPAIELQPVYLLNLRMARCPCLSAEMATTSAGLSIAMMARAAARSFSYVQLRLIMHVPIQELRTELIDESKLLNS
jgi:hypothetical protein